MKEFWTNETDEALIKYVTTEDMDEKNRLYNNHLFTPFRKLIDVLLERYSIPIVDNDLKFDILTFLVEHVERFNPYMEKPNGKAYCIVIIRSWFADWKIKTAQQKKLSFDVYHETNIK